MNMSYPELPDTLIQIEKETLKRWKEEDLFRQSLAANAGGEPFVFYEGPPTANGRPGLHHVIGRTIKDLVCRFHSMEGRTVTRIAGWDTHGLPVEIEAEKKLGISGKPEIEELGIADFNQTCKDSVFTYKEEWEELSERIGYWLEYWRPYVTFHPDYIESVWWIVKEFAEKGLLYRGHKSVPYCPRCGTALSSHEVAQGYKEVEDPSLTFIARVVNDQGDPDPAGRAFLVWTTTPWTVPSNTGLAVHPDLTYVEVLSDNGCYIVAESRVEALFGETATVRTKWKGVELAGLRYERPLNLVPDPVDSGNGWTVVVEDFVSAEEGTGVVHMAPAFGADDYAAGQKHGLPMINPIDDAGCFIDSTALVGGQFVKDADSALVDELRSKEKLFDIGRVTHSYPHCWRCASPLLYVARDSWFAATSRFRETLLANNDQVKWYPAEVGENRFGEWLRGNVDWALSRDRYWGTPLPVWVCDEDRDHLQWIGSFSELSELVGKLPEDFDPHRPFIDDYSWPCAECAGTMRRAPEVIDVWFDSGAMPFAQWHYPFDNSDEFDTHFPADFISEGLDQTRGWFYSLLAISTLLGKGTPFKNVIVNDLVLDAEGQKMSKSKGNVVNPWDAIEEHGSDALRWYFITSSNPWVPKRYDSMGVKEAARRFFDTLFNTYRFFTLYASAEEWSPSDADPLPDERMLLDRWLLSRLDSVVSVVRKDLEAYQITRAYRALGDFVVEDLSNWYVRRSRSRFWGNSDIQDTRAAFRTLWEALGTITRLAAPIIPFASDWMYRALTNQSVHLQRFPEEVQLINEDLEQEMSAARLLVSLGRAAREEAQIRVRQPLRCAEVILPQGKELSSEVLGVVREELNVKDVIFRSSLEGLVTLVARPNYAALGPVFGKATNTAAEVIRALSQEKLEEYRDGGIVEISVDDQLYRLVDGDAEIVQEASGTLLVKGEGATTLALDTELDDELLDEGIARELVNRVQRLRKDAGLEITDRIELGIAGALGLQDATASHREFISGETLALNLVVDNEIDGEKFAHLREVEINDMLVQIGLSVVTE